MNIVYLWLSVQFPLLKPAIELIEFENVLLE